MSGVIACHSFGITFYEGSEYLNEGRVLFCVVKFMFCFHFYYIFDMLAYLIFLYFRVPYCFQSHFQFLSHNFKWLAPN